MQALHTLHFFLLAQMQIQFRLGNLYEKCRMEMFTLLFIALHFYLPVPRRCSEVV